MKLFRHKYYAVNVNQYWCVLLLVVRWSTVWQCRSSHIVNPREIYLIRQTPEELAHVSRLQQLPVVFRRVLLGLRREFRYSHVHRHLIMFRICPNSDTGYKPPQIKPVSHFSCTAVAQYTIWGGGLVAWHSPIKVQPNACLVWIFPFPFPEQTLNKNGMTYVTIVRSVSRVDNGEV